MNRRTVLRSASVLATVGLAGCIQGVQEHFGLQGVVPVEIHNSGSQSYKIQLQARELGNDRRSYNEQYSVSPNETAYPPHLGRTEQSLQVVLFDEDNEQEQVEAVSITSDTEFVSIELTDAGMVIEVDRADDAANETVTNATNDSSAANGSTEPTTAGNETTDSDADSAS
ncbi:hypothetical protein [Halopiger aswanensis]|uniref:Uncharacterized protein n=1 Tax=Halopiger aswanensis TaxID=148449 RepID=A0A419WHK1_9EURY|nr:hypothetical protein [Halopiger aswanensis]RKD95031.1 hypothetical protein ATJ93_1880 [Halopiger aswanensis]